MFIARLVNQFTKLRNDGGSFRSWRQSQVASSASFSSHEKGASSQFARRQLRNYRFTEINAADTEQVYISGSGPGGSKVNAAQNAVQLKHKPTNIVVKVHESRLLPENVKIAFERLKFAVDRHLNGENCYEEQFKRLQRKREAATKRAREKRRQLRSCSPIQSD
ncbi:RF-PROK-I domain-containing protein [Aphelenchoides besseyi]|nr:RF-PROK-I domain-containing protein [Aphelenchoides besseyi]KAI6210760.1 RF-PROK-I domain-containing protein [Aphelenchoides besseyi]